MKRELWFWVGGRLLWLGGSDRDGTERRAGTGETSDAEIRRPLAVWVAQVGLGATSEPPAAGRRGGLRAAARARPRRRLSGAREPPETTEFFRVNYHMH